jgi:hypothetical protein
MYILWPFGISTYGYLVYFSHFGMLNQEKSCNPTFYLVFRPGEIHDYFSNGRRAYEHLKMKAAIYVNCLLHSKALIFCVVAPSAQGQGD